MTVVRFIHIKSNSGTKSLYLRKNLGQFLKKFWWHIPDLVVYHGYLLMFTVMPRKTTNIAAYLPIHFF